MFSDQRILGGIFTSFLAVVAFSTTSFGASPVSHETLTPGEASRLGMVVQWEMPLSVSGGLDQLVDAQIHVDRIRKRTIFEVSYDGGSPLRFPADMNARGGLPLGEKEAERLALMETYKLKRIGKQAVVNRTEVPQIRLYSIAKDGTLEGRDAETGQLLWVQRFGDSRLKTTGMSLNNDVVTFVNGMTLYIVDAMTGKEIDHYRLNSPPLMAPSILGDYVMTPCMGRKIEGYALSDLGGERITAMTAGIPLAPPTRAPGGMTMMWPTDSGFVYAMEAEGAEAELAFRFAANGLVSSRIVATTGDQFFMASEKGQVYAINAHGSGRLMWRQSLGEPIYTSPVLVGDKVLVRTVYGHLYCMNAATGEFVWPSPVNQVAKVLGGDNQQILVRTSTSHLEAIDASSGTVLIEFFATNVVDAVDNPHTDRLYLLTSNGGIQCLRSMNNELPVYMMPEPTSSAGENESSKPATEGGTGSGSSETDLGTDPFGLDAGNDAGFGEDSGMEDFDDPFKDF